MPSSRSTSTTVTPLSPLRSPTQAPQTPRASAPSPQPLLLESNRSGSVVPTVASSPSVSPSPSVSAVLGSVPSVASAESVRPSPSLSIEATESDMRSQTTGKWSDAPPVSSANIPDAASTSAGRTSERRTNPCSSDSTASE